MREYSWNQSQSLTIEIPADLKKELRNFRFAYRNKSAAFVVKINKSTLLMEKDGDTYEEFSMEELADGELANRSSEN